MPPTVSLASGGAAPEITSAVATSTTSNFHAGGSGGVLLNTADVSGARFVVDNHIDYCSDADAVSMSDSDNYALDSDPDDDSESDHEQNHDHTHGNNISYTDSSISPVQDAQAKTDQTQADMRKLIVAIQQDQSISSQEKSKKIQELMTSQWASRQRRHSNRSVVASNRLDNKPADFGIITAADCQISTRIKLSSVASIIKDLASSKRIAVESGFRADFAMTKYQITISSEISRYDCCICRIGKGLGQDYFHCKKCNVCMAISLKGKHKCIERNLESDCPICGEYMFTSTTTVIFMKDVFRFTTRVFVNVPLNIYQPCGHCIHYKCHQEYIQTSYQCPTCFKSLANMTEYFKRIDAMLGQHQMPPEYLNSYTYVYCNDCEKKCYAKFHFLYHKCISCKGYNTKILQTMEGKEGTTLDTLNEALSSTIADASSRSGGTSTITASTRESEILRESAIESIRHISSATPGFSTSNTSVLSASSQLSVPVSANSSLYASLNPNVGREVFLAVDEESIRSRTSMRSYDQMDISFHASVEE
ncbi:hypothetical protein HK100_005879 [Physocladia obscura]|uniref:Uncharacterized protein n=1 Tax=Physocladia obscura TaxID=109957 RepID=A0AAD5XFD0_9FUNG|nr:hypothetical protein HK100_005879 [Physocladia obscura]